MSNKHCAYGLCKSDSRTDPSKVFVPFAKPRRNLERAKRWVHLCGRKDFDVSRITKDTYICADHFPPGEILDARKNLSLEPYPQSLEAKCKVLHQNRIRDLRAKISNNEASTLATAENEDVDPMIEIVEPTEFLVTKASSSKTYAHGETKLTVPIYLPVKIGVAENIDEVKCAEIEKAKWSRWTQTEARATGTIQKAANKISDFILKSDRCAKVLTGLDKEQRNSLWEFLDDSRDDLTIIGSNPPKLSGALRTISVESQFLMTLLILRRNWSFEEVAASFEMSRSFVGQIFKTWIQFIYHKFQDIKDIMFLKRRDIHKPLPRSFQNNLLRNVRVVIDCTEIQVESSKNYRQQGNTYSSYKSKTTAKILIGVVPSGACCFVSHCFEGAISDRQIVVQSGFLDYLEEGDVVLADRGFNIDDLVREKGASLVIPPFLKGRAAFSLEETRATKQIARARIHIERFNQRMKIFNFLNGPISNKHFPMISQIVYVCCMLANLSTLLVNK